MHDGRPRLGDVEVSARRLALAVIERAILDTITGEGMGGPEDPLAFIDRLASRSDDALAVWSGWSPDMFGALARILRRRRKRLQAIGPAGRLDAVYTLLTKEAGVSRTMKLRNPYVITARRRKAGPMQQRREALLEEEAEHDMEEAMNRAEWKGPEVEDFVWDGLDDQGPELDIGEDDCE